MGTQYSFLPSFLPFSLCLFLSFRHIQTVLIHSAQLSWVDLQLGMEWNAMDVQDPYDYDYSFDRRSRYCRRMYRAVEWRKVSK